MKSLYLEGATKALAIFSIQILNRYHDLTHNLNITCDSFVASIKSIITSEKAIKSVSIGFQELNLCSEPIELKSLVTY
jgi:hypothetical protein